MPKEELTLSAFICLYVIWGLTQHIVRFLGLAPLCLLTQESNTYEIHMHVSW